MWGNGLDRFGSRQEQLTGTCECGNETSGSINRKVAGSISDGVIKSFH
jgi:hypothetical protein